MPPIVILAPIVQRGRSGAGLTSVLLAVADARTIGDLT
jgi:hypothetical protein